MTTFNLQPLSPGFQRFFRMVPGKLIRRGRLVVGCWMFPLILFAGAASAGNPPVGMVQIPAGLYHPLFPGATGLKKVPVKAFYLDVLPVSNGDFLEFVRANPLWQRSRVKRIFADESYLKNWQGDLEPGRHAPRQAPVVYVSWFAARAYAHWRGERLPTV